MHLPSTQQMQVQMKNCLAGVGANVVNGTKAVFQLALFGDFCSDQMGIADNFCICLRQVIDTGNVLLGNDQNVRRRARFDVFKGEDILVFVHLLRWNRAGDDLAEEAVSHSRE